MMERDGLLTGLHMKVSRLDMRRNGFGMIEKPLVRGLNFRLRFRRWHRRQIAMLTFSRQRCLWSSKPV
jgi:hypothetical protein